MGWNLYSTLRRPPPEEAVKISVHVLVSIVIFGPQIGLLCVLGILKKKYWGGK